MHDVECCQWWQGVLCVAYINACGLCSAYVECVNGGIFEWATVNDELVHFFANVTGYLTAALGDDWIIAADSGNNIASLLHPQGMQHTYHCSRQREQHC